jgi:hypothetical protein
VFNLTDAEKLFKKLLEYRNSESDFVRFCKDTLGGVERTHFDFKEKQDARDGKLGDRDKKNLAKAVSGFANSGGGVLIWGFRDGTLEEKPINEIQEFVNSLLDLAPNTTDPFVHGIDGAWISNDGNTGYALVYIPESTLPPHRVVLKGDIQQHYYVRTGSSFVIATHTMLEDMFGRRPKPQIEVIADLLPVTGVGTLFVINILISIINKGRGVAKGPYLALHIPEPYKKSKYGIDGNGGRGLQPLPSPRNDFVCRYGSQNSILIHSGIKWPVDTIEGEFQNTTDFAILGDVEIPYTLAAEGVRPLEGVLRISSVEIARTVEEYRGK